MKLRYWLITYHVSLHAVFILPTYYLLREQKLMLFLVEGFYATSFIIGIILIRLLFKPFDLIATGTELIEEEDFISTLRPTGHRELDRLISLFNTMLRKLRNERLQTEQQHQFLSKLIHAIPSGIIMLDYDGHIVSLNPAAEHMLGQRTDELAGQLVSGLGEPLYSALQSLPDDNAVVMSFHGNRRLKVYRSRFFDHGFPRTFIVIEELTEEIRKSEKAAYESLIRLMSHEINNSVGAVGSLLQSSRHYAGQIAEADRGDFITAIDVSINRLKNLDSFMRQYADIVHLPQPRLHETDIVALLERCAGLFRDESQSVTVRWHWQIDDLIPPVLCDHVQMEHVFINVFKNAVESLTLDGDIYIRCLAENNRVIVCVRDTGCGIPPEVQDQLFNPFFSTKQNGQGIGLTLVREILDRHEFQFLLEPGPEGGAVFMVHMPIGQNRL